MVRVPTASTSILSSDGTSSQMQDQTIMLRDSSSISSSNSDDDGGYKAYHHLRFDQPFESTFASSSFLFWAIYENNKEIILGSCAAIVVFVTVLMAFIVSKRKSRTMEKAPLVDNEVSVNVDVERLTIHV